jgi:hypothetical protein
MKQKKPILFSNLKFLPLLNLTLFCFAAAYLVVFFWLAVQRMRYPFELEWIEGGMVDQVQRLVHGQSMYVAPSINYVPFLYPPLYFYLSALVSLIVGSGFFPLRLVSFIASLVSFVVIFLIVYAETRDKWVAMLSTGLFAAFFRVTGAWLDIARVDSLFLALWLLFIYFARSRQSWKSSVLAGVFAGWAYLTKQTALIACLPLMVYLFWRNWKFGLSMLGVAALIVGSTTLALDLASSGWYTYYIYGLLSQQTEWLPLQFITFWKSDLAVQVPLVILFLLFFLFGRPKQDRHSLIQWLSILLGALAGTFISRVKIGGYDNVLLLLYAAIALLFGLGLSTALKTIRQLPVEHKIRLEGLVQAAVLIQLVMLVYNPFAQLPTSADLDAGYQLIQKLSHVKGEVYLPDHGYLPTLAGKRTYAHQAAIWDILRGEKPSKGKTILVQDLQNALQNQVFDEIILDSELDLNWCCGGIDQTYIQAGQVFQDQETFYPVTGDKFRPTYIYIAKRLAK